jgi:hypothetical protein
MGPAQGSDATMAAGDAQSQTHYGVVAEGDDYRAARLGSVVELGVGNQRRREVTAEIIAAAQANGGVYSSEAHLKHLRSAQPERTEAQLSSRVRSAEDRLAFVAGHAGSGVRGAGDGTFTVDGEAFDRFSRRGMQRVDVRPLSHQTLTEQTEARAFTWLDRQTFGSTDPRLLASEGIHIAVAEAGQRRAEWLIAQGYAERSGTEPGEVRLLPGAIRRLAGDEREAADRKLTERNGLPVVELPQGGSVTGKYQGVETLHSGKRAVVVTDENVFVAPVRRAPRIGASAAVSLTRTGSRDASVKAVTGAAKSSGAAGIGAPGAQMYLGGLEAGR